jgi:hypothetical protein
MKYEVDLSAVKVPRISVNPLFNGITRISTSIKDGGHHHDCRRFND